uniref:Uncharacterized protein n=1 Tax=Sphaerodactylus townsendi TaxID=933632 RepID=A0ACB8E9I7_9SAUR
MGGVRRGRVEAGLSQGKLDLGCTLQRGRGFGGPWVGLSTPRGGFSSDLLGLCWMEAEKPNIWDLWASVWAESSFHTAVSGGAVQGTDPQAGLLPPPLALRVHSLWPRVWAPDTDFPWKSACRLPRLPKAALRENDKTNPVKRMEPDPP